ncbi:hypothetical protein CIB48_g4758 [Xylaria polymorpha]|nr:hypothetical protein CIB48_g4758 [Xylaria polymorpha]
MQQSLDSFYYVPVVTPGRPPTYHTSRLLPEPVPYLIITRLLADMSAVKALRDAVAALENRNRSPGPNTSQLRPRANKGNDALAQMYKAEQMREAAEKARKGPRILDQCSFRQQSPRSHPRPFHSNLKWVWKREEAETTPAKADQDPQATNTTREQSPNPYTRQGYPNANTNNNLWARQETERDPTTRRLETSDLTESADVPEVAVQEHRVTSPGAGLLDSNTIFPSPPQRKRKRCAEADPTQEKPLRKRR